MDRSQRWLTEKVNEMTGLKADEQYVYKVISGVRTSPTVTTAINQILGIRQ